MDWLTEHKLPIGKWLGQGVDLLNQHASGFFDWMSMVLETLINGTTAGLLWLPAGLLIAAVVGLAWWLHRSWGLVVFCLLSLLLIVNLG